MYPPYVKPMPKSTKEVGNGQLWQLADRRFVEIVTTSLPFISNLSVSSDDKEAIKLWDTFALGTVSIISPGKLPAATSRPHDSVLNLPDVQSTPEGKAALGLHKDFVGTLQEYEAFDIEIFENLAGLFLNSEMDPRSSPITEQQTIAEAAPTSFGDLCSSQFSYTR